MQGSPIKIVINIENDILFLHVLISPMAFADEIVGTKAVENAILNDIGSVTNVSTFPLKIPYWILACSSDKNFFSPLTTVIESTFLFIVPITAPIDIGTDTDKISLIVFLILVGL